jgi:hypothetical protein
MSNEKGDGPKNPQKKFGKIKKDKHNSKNMKNGAKGPGKARARHLHVINVVVQIILPENIEPPNIWLNYIKNP